MPKASKTGVTGLIRRPDGRYKIDFRWLEPNTGERRRFQKTLPADTPAGAAKRYAQEVVRLALQGGWNPRADDTAKVRDALDKYIEWRKTNKPKGLKQQQSVARVLRKHLGDVRLDKLSPFDVERYKRNRRAEGAGPGTINRSLAMLKHLHKLSAELWGIISREKAESIRGVKLLAEPDGRVRELSDDEYERLAAAMEGRRAAPLIRTALLTGMRRADVVKLRRSAVDFASGFITVGDTKSGRALRVPITPELEPVLREAMNAEPTRKAPPWRKAKERSEDFVFLNSAGRPYTLDGFSTEWQRIRARAGLRDLRFHDLRHDFATRTRRGGASLEVVGRLLGHRTLAMVQRYAHIGDDELARAASHAARR